MKKHYAKYSFLIIISALIICSCDKNIADKGYSFYCTGKYADKYHLNKKCSSLRACKGEIRLESTHLLREKGFTYCEKDMKDMQEMNFLQLLLLRVSLFWSCVTTVLLLIIMFITYKLNDKYDHRLLETTSKIITFSFAVSLIIVLIKLGLQSSSYR